MKNQTFNNSIFTNNTTIALPIEVYIITMINYAMKMFIIRIISAMGLIFNINSMIICSNNKLTHKFYHYLWCRGLINSIVCMFGIFFLQMNASPQSYLLVFATVFIINIPLRLAFMASAFSELALIINRLSVVGNKKNFFSEMSKPRNLIFCFTIPVLGGTLSYAAIEIIDSPDVKGMYIWSFSEFGKSSFYQYFQILSFFFETILPIFILLTLNLYTYNKFNVYLSNKSALIKKKDKQTNKKFTKLMIVLVSLSIFVRSIDMISGIFIRLKVQN